MKRVLALFTAVMAVVFSAKAEVEFAYEAGAELVSAYIWRGMNNGGLSIQPEGLVGFDALDEAIQFRAGIWGSFGATDWKFEKNQPVLFEDYNPNTYFMPEIDFIASLSAYGASIGFNEYYYCDDGESHQSEIWFGYNFDYFFGQSAYFNWYTVVAGADMNIDPSIVFPAPERRAYSTYIELGYDYTFEDWGLTLGAQIGMSPWQSQMMYYNDKFAVVNLSLKADKEFDLGVCTLNIWATGSLNPDGMNTDKDHPGYNVFVNAAGDDKLYMQKLNGAIGLGVWF
ncbi:MAG: hypothetical protein IKX20_06250 [Paludibacteraceae bacterium]|nr:hypothetical protein [Paludibacteraceae bacterium]